MNEDSAPRRAARSARGDDSGWHDFEDPCGEDAFRYYARLANELRDDLAGSPLHQTVSDPASVLRRLSLYERTWGLAVPAVLVRRALIKLVRWIKS